MLLNLESALFKTLASISRVSNITEKKFSTVEFTGTYCCSFKKFHFLFCWFVHLQFKILDGHFFHITELPLPELGHYLKHMQILSTVENKNSHTPHPQPPFKAKLSFPSIYAVL